MDQLTDGMSKKPLVARWLEKLGIRTTPRWDQVIALIQEIVILFVVIRLINTMVIMTSLMGSTSMEPTLQVGDITMLEKFTFRLGLRNLQPGDIIIFRAQGFSRNIMQKRIIAVGGQRIQIKDCYAYVDGQPLTDDTFNHPAHPDPRRRCYYNIADHMPPELEILIPEGHYFVLGDNSPVSFDSRFPEVRFIKHEDVVGRVILRIWPLLRFGVP